MVDVSLREPAEELTNSRERRRERGEGGRENMAGRRMGLRGRTLTGSLFSCSHGLNLFPPANKIQTGGEVICCCLPPLLTVLYLVFGVSPSVSQSVEPVSVPFCLLSFRNVKLKQTGAKRKPHRATPLLPGVLSAVEFRQRC